MKILLVHGWAFEPKMWWPLQQRLSALLDRQDLEFHCADLGFYGPAYFPEGHFDVAIGHSFGLVWLLESKLARFDRLVSINGFSCFGAKEDFQCGWPHRILNRMRKGLATDTQAVIRQFFENSQAFAQASEFTQHSTTNLENADTERLDWGLEALIHSDMREQWSQFDGPQCVIAATNDQIVTSEHTNACFVDDDIQWLKSDSHCLPVRFPEICAALVREMIEVS